VDTASGSPLIFVRGKAEFSTHASVRAAFMMHRLFALILALPNAFPAAVDAQDRGQDDVETPGVCGQLKTEICNECNCKE